MQEEASTIADLPFSEATKRWFNASFEAPTSAQIGAWKSIAQGENTLVVAPTGSGKTLSAFLWAIDRLAAHSARRPSAGQKGEPEGIAPPGAGDQDSGKRSSAKKSEGVKVLYISPMKALGVDVQRNLRSPLAGITQFAESLGVTAPSITVGVRSGDTSAQERRKIASHPPDILITTPESLYLLLTSSASAILESVETVIVDEIHALAANKRGAHLALSLERLDALLAAPAQRIGLSATVKPVEEVARFLGGRQPVAIVAPPAESAFEITVEVPAEDMTNPPTFDETVDSEESGEHRLGSMWPSIEDALYRRILEVQSTIVFANSRRLAERLTNQLNALHSKRTEAEMPLARVHHGSVSKEQRESVEEALKAGQLRCVVSTSSLELGIDMGLVDQVIQIDAPPSVASGLQRIGRAGHHVGGVSKAVFFPTHRSRLLETAGVIERMRAGEIETMHVLQNPLDVLAQQTVAAVAMKDWNVDRWYEVVSRAAPYQSLPRGAFEATLDLVAGKYPSTEFAQLRPRLIWDREANTLSARPGSQRLAVTQGGTIPDRGLFRVVTVGEGAEKSRVGELDEEMVYESRVGEVFTLGTTSWRIREITKDTVEVIPAFGIPGKMPFWRGDSAARPFELGEGIGRLTRDLDASVQSGEEGAAARRLAQLGFDANAVANTLAYISEQRESAGGVPSDLSLVVEQSKDEVGDWRLVLESPFGLEVHAPWALALNARIRQLMELEGTATASNDGIIIRLPDIDGDPPGAELFAFEPEEIVAIVMDEIANSPLFAARFRECAARSLILGGGKPGKRSPLWQQRQRSSRLLEIAARYPAFPVVLEAVRECVQDVYDLDALSRIHERIRDGRVKVRQTTVDTPSPFARSMLFGYVGAFMYEGDAPAGERRLAALSVDPELLRELLGDVNLADILEVDAITQVEDELQRSVPGRRLRGAEGAVDLLRLLGPLSSAEVAARLAEDDDGDRSLGLEATSVLLDSLTEQRRVIPVRMAGEERFAVTEDAGLLQQGLGLPLPPGIPAAYLVAQADALSQLLLRYALNRGPFSADEAATRFGIGVAVAARELDHLRKSGVLLEGTFHPHKDPQQPQWIHRDVLARIRSRSIAILRGSVEAVPQNVYAAFLQEWQGIGSSETGVDAVEAALEVLDSVALPASTWETLVLPARMPRYHPQDLDLLISTGQVLWVGEGELAKNDGLVSFHLRDSAHVTLPLPGTPEPGLETLVVEILRQRGALFAPELLDQARRTDPSVSVSKLDDALWSLAWKSTVTTDNLEALRAAVRGSKAAQKTQAQRRRPRRLRTSMLANMTSELGGSPPAVSKPTLSGRWSLLPEPTGGDDHRFMAKVSLLLDRYAVLTRGVVAAEPVEGGFARAYRVLTELEKAGQCRRGYLIEGLGGAQFATSPTVDRLRDFAEHFASHNKAPDSAQVLSATDPANPYGALLPWPTNSEGSQLPETQKPRRNPGALVILIEGQVVFYLERGGRTAVDLFTGDGQLNEADALRETAAIALADALTRGRLNTFTLEKIDGQSALDSPWAAALLTAGFEQKPRGLIWRKRLR